MSAKHAASQQRPPKFSDAWWEQWRQVMAIARARNDKKLIRRLETAAAVGMTGYIAGEVAYAAGEKVREISAQVVSDLRYAISILGV